MEENYNDLKVYEVYVKYVGITLDDGDELIYEAYSPLPRGHAIEKQLIKLSLKDAMRKIKEVRISNDLYMDYHGAVAYTPASVKKIYWTKDEDIARNTYMIDITGSKEKFDIGVTINVGDNQYVCHKIIDWEANFNAKFIYGSKVVKSKVEVKPKVEVVKGSEKVA